MPISTRCTRLHMLHNFMEIMASHKSDRGDVHRMEEVYWTDGRRRPYCMKSSGTYCVFSIIMISLWQLYCLMVLGQV